MKGYKGFKKGLICRDKQYAENTVFEEDLAMCGMHFCKSPFDVLDYYPIFNDNGEHNEFAEVEALDETKTDDNKKFCTKKLKIGSKINFADFVNLGVEYIKEETMKEFNNDEDGHYAKIGSSGNYAKIGSSGNYAKIGSSGHYAQIGSSGDCVQIGSSGDYAKIGSSGYSAKIGSSGDYAQIGSSGHYAKIGSSGDSAKIGSSGDYAVVMCAGMNSVAKAKKGSWITLAEWEYSEEKERYIPVCVKTEQVDGEKIKEDTFYRLKDGEFEEAWSK